MVNSPQVTVENDLAFLQDVSCSRRAQSIVYAMDGGKIDSRFSGTEDNRCNQHVKSVDSARFDKTRYCPGTTFDQYPLESVLVKRARNSPRAAHALIRANPKALHPGRQITALGTNDNAINAIVIKALCIS